MRDWSCTARPTVDLTWGLMQAAGQFDLADAKFFQIRAKGFCLHGCTAQAAPTPGIGQSIVPFALRLRIGRSPPSQSAVS